MSQAEEKDTEGPEFTAEPEEASQLNRLIGDSPGETMTNCAEAIEFVAFGAASIDHGGGTVDGNAVHSIMATVSAALKYEAERVEFKRKGAKS